MTIRESKATLSQPSPRFLHTLNILAHPNSKPFYECVLKYVPTDFEQVGEFGNRALKELSLIPAVRPFKRISDVVQILSGLSEAGLIQIRNVELREGHYDRLIGAKVEYRRNIGYQSLYLRAFDVKASEVSCVELIRDPSFPVT